MKQIKIIKFLFIIVSLFFVCSSSAQKIKGGVMLGFTTSQIDRDTQKGYKKMGGFAGVFVKTKFTKIIGAKIEMNYNAKGAVKTINKIEEFKTHLNYIEMPILLSTDVFKKLEIDIGISPAYLISSKLYDAGNEVPETNYNLHNYDLAGLFSIFYSFSNKFALNVRFYYSIIPINDTPGWLNSNFSFALVYKFN